MKKILFVCLGNICRSTMAEAIFKYKVKNLKMDNQFDADSAGTSNYHIGTPPDHRTMDVLKKYNIDYQHLGRQVIREDAKKFDYIIAMDSMNFANLKNILPQDFKNLYLMRDFDYDFEKGEDVPDPYYGGMRDFEYTYQILNRCIDNFIEFLKK